MNHRDHVNLLKDGIVEQGGVWADFGSGSGAFTLALAELLGPSGQIHSIDWDRFALRQQKQAIMQQFPQTAVSYHTADYTKPLNLPLLDGIIVANTLHFYQGEQRLALLLLLKSYLKENGRLILVEYDTNQGNRWVPYPMTFPMWQQLATKAGFKKTTQLATRNGRFLGGFYSALSI